MSNPIETYISLTSAQLIDLDCEITRNLVTISILHIKVYPNNLLELVPPQQLLRKVKAGQIEICLKLNQLYQAPCM